MNSQNKTVGTEKCNIYHPIYTTIVCRPVSTKSFSIRASLATETTLNIKPLPVKFRETDPRMFLIRK